VTCPEPGELKRSDQPQLLSPRGEVRTKRTQGIDAVSREFLRDVRLAFQKRLVVFVLFHVKPV